MSFYYINVEGKWKTRNFFFKSEKNVKTPCYELLLHECKNNRDMQKCKKMYSKRYTSPADEFILHTVGAIKKLKSKKIRCSGAGYSVGPHSGFFQIWKNATSPCLSVTIT